MATAGYLYLKKMGMQLDGTRILVLHDIPSMVLAWNGNLRNTNLKLTQNALATIH